MMRKAVCLLITCLNLVLVYGQDTTRLNQLLLERKSTYQEYVFLNAQNNNFWGKKSKKDLLNIIETLKNIIRKDTQIIREIENESLKKQAQVTMEKEKLENLLQDDKRVVNDNLYELKTQIANLQNLQKVKQREVNVAREKAEALELKKKKYDQMLGLCLLIIVGLLFYIFQLQRRITKRKQ